MQETQSVCTTPGHELSGSPGQIEKNMKTSRVQNLPCEHIRLRLRLVRPGETPHKALEWRWMHICSSDHSRLLAESQVYLPTPQR